jgi:hypothetical protein
LLHGLQGVYLALALLAAMSLVIAWLFPGGAVESHVHQERDAIPAGH